MANEGLPDIPTGFMARAADLVRAAGGVVIADEVNRATADLVLGGVMKSAVSSLI